MIITKEQVLSRETIFVFGYGSLIWKPDFEFTRRFVAYLPGHERRFWQGSPHHRGIVEKPGRVLTLKQAPEVKYSSIKFFFFARRKVLQCYKV